MLICRYVRELPRVQQTFSAIWGTSDLITSFDGGNVFRFHTLPFPHRYHIPILILLPFCSTSSYLYSSCPSSCRQSSIHRPWHRSAQAEKEKTCSPHADTNALNHSHALSSPAPPFSTSPLYTQLHPLLFVSVGSWFHVDQGRTSLGFHCVQGLVSFYPATEATGGLTVIPGTHHDVSLPATNQLTNLSFTC